MTTTLALRALGLGDALTGVPALRGLRRARPGSRLVLAGPPETGELLLAEGVVDAVLPVRGLEPLAPDALVRAAAEHPGLLGGVDLAVNLHGRGPQSTAALAALSPRELVAFDARGRPVWSDDVHEVERWCALVRGLGGACGADDLVLRDVPLTGRTGPVVVHPGAASPSRRWPAGRWAQVVTALREQGRAVVVTGAGAEAGVCAQVAAAGARDLCGRLSVAQLLELVASSPLLLSGDTGAAHVATATRTPSVLLFGPTSPARWGPAVDADRHRVVWRTRPGDAPGDPHADAPDPVLLRATVSDVLAGTVG